MPTYIFGYGSLMNSSSRQLTGQIGHTVPAVVTGLIRYWGKVDESYSASPLVSDLGDGIVNGVLLAIPHDQLQQFDTRERGYQRVRLSLNQIEASITLSPESDVWVYIKPEPLPPCVKYPVLQTYIDTVLSGCLEISEDFARLFIQHTHGWHAPISNDRHAPRYGNYAGVSDHHLIQIDQLLAELSQ